MTKFIKRIEDGHMIHITADHDQLLKDLEAAKIKIGKTVLKPFLNGERTTAGGCVIVDMSEAGAAAPAAAPAPAGETAGTAPAGDAGAGAEEPSRALKEHTVGGTGEIVTAPAPAPAPAAAKTARARATIKASEPKGKVKPVRKGTKIADGMELLLKGATLAELEAAAASDVIGDDVVDFCNRRVTKRGYGIKIEGDKFFLVAPGGLIQYTASAADEPKEPKTAAAPTGTAAPAPTVEGGEAAAPAPAPAATEPAKTE